MTGVCDVKEESKSTAASVHVSKVMSKQSAGDGMPLKEEASSKKDVSNGITNGNHANGDGDCASDPEIEIQSDTPAGNGQNGAEKAAEGEEDGEGIVLIQDMGFTIQIQSPGAEPFDLPVSTMELVQEIYQVLVDREDTCHRTCFTLQLDGLTLDNFAELKSFEGLAEGSVLKVVEEPYTMREARIHLRHLRDLLKSVDSIDAYNGVDCASLSFLNTVTGGDILDKKAPKPETIDCTPPEYIMPGSKERPLLPLHPQSKEATAPQCIKVLTYSGWNPPPGNRKMHGDLMYLYVVTMEDKRYHITASTKGFYVNQSTTDDFNPRPQSQPHLNHSLIDLLNSISPIFKKNFALLLKKRAQKHPFERVATPYQVYSWMTPRTEHTIDYIRAEDAFSSRLGYEEQIPGQTRDWNEELQTTRELPRKNLPERLIRERAIFKVHSDFVAAATRGAMAVIDGNIMAINPGEETKMQMFLWNNIFFSLGFDVKDHYKDFGGDAAAYAAPGNDLQGVKAYASVDAEGLYTLGTVVVDYRGYRVTAQSIIPGILEREQEQSVVYGSIDFGKTIVTSETYVDLLKKSATALKIRPHKVVNDKEEEIELYSSVECKGITGNDGRHYVLDLLRTFPADLNFFPDSGVELNEEVKQMGFPRTARHKLVSLRQELVDAFVDNRYIAFVKNAAYQFQQLRLKKMQEAKEKEKAKKESEESGDKAITEKGEKKDDIETDEAKKIVEAFTNTNSESFEENSKEIVKKAAKSVNSLSDTEFSIGFNTDLFQPHVKHAHEGSEEMQREKNLVRDAAEFLLVHQIPSFMRDCLEHTSSPIDGYTLTEALHHNGINMRYLGKVTELIAKHPQLSYLHTICVSELVTRSTKHLFQTYMQGVETMSLSAGVSHFLNCVLGSFPNPHAAVTDELKSQRSKKRNRKRNKNTSVAGAAEIPEVEWAAETPRSLWKKIATETEQYYHFKLNCDGIDSCVEKYGVQQVSLLRVMCKKLGIQLSLKEYPMDGRTRQAFTEDDIINIHPVVKHIHPKATDAYHVFTTGQQKIQQGLLRDGYELISEALNLLNNVYGAMHPEIAACARLLARLNYIMGDYGEALAYQQRAVLMSERVLGIDHPNTITECAHLALYCFANNQISTALRLMYHARYLALLCHGENHPEVALFDSNIGLILHAVGEFDLSLKFLMKALELNTKFFGEQSLKVAMTYHLVARAYSCKGDFRTALGHERDAFGIYKSLLGEDHERTKESSECLRHLTQQAVKFQKTMNEIYKGEKSVQIPPLQIHTPTLANVLDTLNLINGIVFLHISQEDIDKFREEMLRRQQEPSGADKLEIEQSQEKDAAEVTAAGDAADNTNNSNSAIEETASAEDVQR